jgi:membrane-associated phospholipid phosphatase
MVRWLMLFVPATLLVVGTKLAYMAFGFGIQSIDFRGVSGHTFNTSAIVPVVLVSLAGCRVAWKTALYGLLGLVFACMVGVSRVVLEYHSVSEVIFGLIVGGATALAYLCGKSTQLVVLRFRAPFFLVLTVLAWALHGDRAPTDALLARVARVPLEHPEAEENYHGSRGPWRVPE